MSEPLDSDLAGDLIGDDVHVTQDPHIGTGISTTFVVNWAQLSVAQVKAYHPQAVVIFIGANDGFPMSGPNGRQVSVLWRPVGRDLRQPRAPDGQYLPSSRRGARLLADPADPARPGTSEDQPRCQRGDRCRRRSMGVQVTVLDTVPIFTPGGVYRDAMKIGGAETIVRQSDGIHLNDAGSSLLARVVLAAIRHRFTY